MKVEEIYINGFGLFHDKRIAPLSSGLNLFMGNNESGKSTLLGFIRAILFGFPDGRSNENPYPPLAGGRHGGTIRLSDGKGRSYVVERSPGKGGGKVIVHKPDQKAGGKEVLTGLLGISSRALYNNVYAFSLLELQDFETLNTSAVEEALYSASAGIDPKGMAVLKEGLEKREGELFKPRRTGSEINKILARLINIGKEKNELKGSVEEYDRAKTRTSNIYQELGPLKNRKTELALELKKIEQKIDILPEWIELALSRRKLEDMEIVESFPSQGIARFEEKRARLEDLQNELQEKEQEVKELDLELGKLNPDKSLLEQGSSINRILKGRDRFDSIQREILSLRHELATGEKKLKEDLSRLGASWDEQRVINFDLSVATREEVRRFRDDLSRYETEERRKKDLFEETNIRRSEAREVLDDLGEPSIKDYNLLNRLIASCRELRTLQSQKGSLREEQRHTLERLNDLKEEKGAQEEEIVLNPPVLSFSFIPACLATGLIFLVMSAFYMAGRIWTLPAGVFCVFFGCVLWLLRKRMQGIIKTRTLTARHRVDVLDSKIEGLENRLGELEARLKDIEERERKEKEYLSFSGLSDPESPDRGEQDLGEKMKHMERWNNAGKAFEQAERRYKDVLSDVQLAEKKKRETEDNWRKWLKDNGLAVVLSPGGALDTLVLIQSLKEQVQGVEQIRTRISDLEHEKAGSSALVSDVLKACGRNQVKESDIPGAAGLLARDFAEAQKSEQRRDFLLKDLESRRRSAERITDRIRNLEEEIKNLIVLGGARGEEDFRKRGLVHEERNALKKDIETRERNIKRVSGTMGDPEGFMQEISGDSLEELEKQKIKTKSELEETEATIEQLKNEYARLEERVAGMVDDERLAELRAEEEGLREESGILAEEWAVVRLAKGLVRRAMNKYEKERQPAVISEAGHYFRRMTGGMYSSIVAPMGEKRIEVVSRDNSRKAVNQLSRGTAEQLYLALRFGFIREFSRNSDSLPVIMDDILVNFDPKRAKKAVKGILELSRDHQVLFFSCHPHVEELFKKVRSDIPVFELSGGEIGGK